MVKKKTPAKTAPSLRIYEILLVVIPLLLFTQTLSFEYVLDDDLFIRNHPLVQEGVASIPEIFSQKSLGYMDAENSQQPYRPVTLSLFALENSMFANSPGIAHGLNVLLLVSIGWLLFRLLLYWFPTVHRQLLFFVVLLFLVHPVHTEVVANVKSRDELLVMFFGLSSMLLFWKHLFVPNSKYLAGSVLLFLFACLSKESGLTWLAVFPLSAFYLKPLTIKETIIQTGIFVIPAAVYIGLWLWVNQGTLQIADTDIINNVLFHTTSVTEAMATRVYIFSEYILLLLAPISLSWDYSFSQIPIVDFTSFRVMGTLLLFIIIGAWGFRKNNFKGVTAFWFLFFIATFSLSSNLFVEIGSTMAERFLFVPSLAFCFLLVWMLAKVLKVDRTSFTGKNKNILIGLIYIIVGLFALKSFSQTKVWSDNLTLARAGVESAPNSARTHFSLGVHAKRAAFQEVNSRKQRTLFEESEKNSLRGLEIYPGFILCRYNLGVMYFETGRYPQAKEQYLRLLVDDSNHVNSLNNLGTILFNEKKYEEALSYLNRALEMEPNHSDALINVGAIYHNTGKLEQAITNYRKAVIENPNNEVVLKNLRIAYTQIGNTDSASYYGNALLQVSNTKK